MQEATETVEFSRRLLKIIYHLIPTQVMPKNYVLSIHHIVYRHIHCNTQKRLETAISPFSVNLVAIYCEVAVF